MENKSTKGRFVRLTYTTLGRTDLTLSEKIILDYRNGFPNRYWAGHYHVSDVLGMPVKTVKNCITNLRKKGFWKEPDHRPKKGSVTTSSSPKMGSEESQKEVHKNPVSPLGTGSRLDSDKIENPEESLERNPTVVGLEKDPQTEGLRNNPNQSQGFVLLETTENQKFTSSLVNDYPRDSNGRRLTKTEMMSSNFDALFDKNTFQPYSEEQVGRGLDE